VATTRRHNLPTSDSGAFTDWAATTTTPSRATEDLSLGFNAGSSVIHGGLGSASVAAGVPSWPPGSSVRYGLPSSAAATEMGMVGLRDVFLVAPAYHHQNAGVISGSDHMNSNAAAAAALGVGVIPLLTAGTPQQNVEDSDINFLGNNRRWQNNNNNHETQYLHFKSTNQTTVGTSSNNSGSGSGASGTATCQDCGNQAKKECKQRRCRTCCKSRGFDCSTHVKSTWVSAARRRERQVMPTGANPTAGSSLSTSSGTKKPRIVGSQQQQQQQATSHTSTSNTPPQSFETSSSRQDGGGSREAWPGQVRAAAVFKCVRVTAVEDGDDEYAYQAVVKIGGHVFKGFLYDQGLEPKEGFPSMSDLHLGGSANNHNGVSASAPILDPPNVVYGGGGGSGGGFYS